MPTTDVRNLIERSTAYFQPIVDLNTGRVIGAETLVRFVDPDGAVHGPNGLVEQIEANPDDVETMTRRLLRLVVENVGPLMDRHHDFYISINVPPVILGSLRVTRVLDDFSLVRYVDRLVCEITERHALTDVGREALTNARPLGLRIAIDDFGTGHSGLKQLIGLPFDILKVDKSVIDPLTNDPTAERLLRGVVALAGALRVKVIAEGVETREQAFFLQAAGVDAGQGWLWSKAVPSDELERLIASDFSKLRGR